MNGRGTLTEVKYELEWKEGRKGKGVVEEL